ncbi:MAG: peptidoglycan-binding protein [Rhodospirillaceae bacterium]|nr:peptidoglycan-binding protein [Rhodospirillales bacterium]
MFRPLAVAIVVSWAAMAPASADYGTGVRYWGHGDFTGAAREFMPAAQAGDGESQYMMGRLYSLGDGVPKDFVQAWVWFDRAARQGHSLAGEARDSMAHILTPDQLALARASGQPVAAQAMVQPQPQQPVEGRQVVLVPRQGVVASARKPAARKPARLAAPGATAEGWLLASGDLTERVRQVQRSLMREGYYDGPADGTLAPVTRDAIRRYQRDVGLPQTGLLSTPMVEQLAQDDQIRMKSDQQQAAR